MQHSSGIYSFLYSPVVYEFVQSIFWGGAGKRTFLNDYLRPRPDDKVLDVGCGSGAFLKYFAKSEYVGIDLSESYIEHASKRSGYPKARFFCMDVGDVGRQVGDDFSLILASGILHHIDDATSLTMLKACSGLLREGGRLVTLDPVFHEGQDPVRKFFSAKDRGFNVKDIDEYRDLILSVFPNAQVDLRTDIGRIPSSLGIAVCVNR